MIVGIDLGTTNSAVSRWNDGRAELIPNALGDVLTPSAVGMTEEGDVLVGMSARERQSTHPQLTATTFKRLMGTTRPVLLGGTRFSPEDLSSLVLRSLKRDAEIATGEEVTGAVITVPAYFNDRQRKATRRAGRLAGLEVERLINEPTAAALAHGIVDRADREPFLVFDLGGGTFDVSIVEIFDGVVEVRASAGDNRLGGEDFNDALAEVARRRLALPGWSSNPSLREAMRVAAERCRRGLTDADAVPFRVVWRDEEHEVEIAADEFEAAVEPLIERLRAPVLRAMRDGDVRSEAMSEIVLVGGATRMPVVRRAVTRMFGRFPSSAVDPDRAVALGAAVQAGLKSRDVDLAEIRLTDVCPYTLGIDVAERDRNGVEHPGVFAPIIERNTVLPASRVHRFRTMSDGQARVEFGIYQGESRSVSGNVELGRMALAVPRRPAGQVAVDCRFSYDVSGLLEVDVTVPGTETSEQMLISDDEAQLDADLDARRAALAELKVHPRDQEGNRALIARAERCYEGFVGERREMAGRLIAFFEEAMASQDGRVVARAAAEVTAQLDRMEGERYL